MKIKLQILLIGISLILSFNFAQAETDVETLAKSLREQINNLQAQILKMQEELTSATEKLIVLEQAIEFNKDLRSGIESEEVKNLQQFLSQYKDIYPEGKVTGFFGPKTEQAIRRFQEKYADDVLKPYGLTKGTGFVGPATRAKLNELTKAATPAVPATPATPAVPATSTQSTATTTPAIPAVPATPAVPAQPATTTPDTTAPANVTNFTLAPGESLITVSWINPTTSDFAGTKLMRKMLGSPASIFDGTEVYIGLSTSITDRALINGISYCYKAFTYDEVPNYSSGVGACASSTSTTSIVSPITATPAPSPTPTPTPTVDTTPPTMSNFQPTGTTTDTTPTLSLTTNESATCKYAYATTTDQSYDSMVSIFSTTGSTSHSVTVGPLATATHTYYARCKDSAGNKDTSSISTVFAVDPSAPDTTAPVISNIQSSSITTTSASISWSTNEESTSLVEYGFTVSYGSTATGASNVVSHQANLSNLASSTAYHYRVKSADSVNNQAQSSDQTFTTLTPVPVDTVAPSLSDLQVSNITQTSATITWTTNEASDSVVEYGLTTSYGSSVSSATTTTSHQINLSGLTSGTTYQYRFKSADSSGNLGYSSDQTLVTSAPTTPVSSGTPQFLLKWGSYGSGDGQFMYLNGIAIDSSGNVYIADTNNDRIQKFTSSGTFITKWSSPGQFAFPWGIALDAGNNVYATEYGLNYYVHKFTSDGTFITKWGSLSNSPNHIAVDGSGNIYVVGAWNDHYIRKFTSNGTFILQWGGLGSGDGQLNFPYGIAIDSNDNVYVSERGNNRVQKFTSSGTFITKWGSQGSGDGQFSMPQGVAIDPSGNVYVVDSSNNRVQKFTSSGTFITKWGSQGSGDGQFSDPRDIAIDASGNIYVTEGSNNRVQKFSSGQLAFIGSSLKDIQSQLAAISAAILELLKR